MFWMAVLLAPFAAMIPGPIGQFFRAFRLVLSMLALSIVVIIGWAGSLAYTETKCLFGDEYDCQMAYGLWQAPQALWGVTGGVIVEGNPEWEKKHALKVHQREIQEQQDRENVIRDYRRRKGLPVEGSTTEQPTTTQPVHPRVTTPYERETPAQRAVEDAQTQQQAAGLEEVLQRLRRQQQELTDRQN